MRITDWLHSALLLQPSMICQVRVITAGHGPPFVTVPVTVMVALLPQPPRTAGGSNDQAWPQGTTLFVGQTICGTAPGAPPPEVEIQIASPTALVQSDGLQVPASAT